MRRMIVGMRAATGAVLSVELLRRLQQCPDVQTHLVLVPRETPLSEIHLDNMLALARMRAIVAPPMPAFYNHPASIGDIVYHIVTRILDQSDVESPAAKRWNGVSGQKAPSLKAVNG
jgi:3-polyprenyl-4-hydroxybenzoate decarboxylase